MKRQRVQYFFWVSQYIEAFTWGGFYALAPTRATSLRQHRRRHGLLLLSTHQGRRSVGFPSKGQVPACICFSLLGSIVRSSLVSSFFQIFNIADGNISYFELSFGHPVCLYVELTTSQDHPPMNVSVGTSVWSHADGSCCSRPAMSIARQLSHSIPSVSTGKPINLVEQYWYVSYSSRGVHTAGV